MAENVRDSEDGETPVASFSSMEKAKNRMRARSTTTTRQQEDAIASDLPALPLTADAMAF
jgi:hypothetical protein